MRSGEGPRWPGCKQTVPWAQWTWILDLKQNTKTMINEHRNPTTVLPSTSRNSPLTNAFSSVIVSAVAMAPGGWSTRGEQFEEEPTSIMFRFPGLTAFSASSPRRGEERNGAHSHSHRQRQLDREGRIAWLQDGYNQIFGMY